VAESSLQATRRIAASKATPFDKLKDDAREVVVVAGFIAEFLFYKCFGEV
jgi:hypothetical protein